MWGGAGSVELINYSVCFLYPVLLTQARPIMLAFTSSEYGLLVLNAWLYTFLFFVVMFLQFIMSLVALLVLLIHVFTKPFKKMYINVIEAAILLNLLMVTAAFLDPSNSPLSFQFSTILVLLPYFYAVGYVICRIGYMIWWVNHLALVTKCLPPQKVLGYLLWLWQASRWTILTCQPHKNCPWGL